ncbi:MAG: C-GCAxxG-C-C family protein [Eubacteriales bacterium]|nr:C-GCAxxG-C-C family protein [Eubacteriales bacterium]
MTKDELREHAQECFLSRKYNCAESVLMTMAEYWGIENPLIPRIATGMGGGVGATHTHICGALSGSILAIGMVLGRDSDDVVDMSAAKKARELMAYVEDLYGSVDCGDIIQVDFSAPDAAQQKQRTRVEICGALVPDCCVWLAENVQPIQKIH